MEHGLETIGVTAYHSGLDLMFGIELARTHNGEAVWTAKLWSKSARAYVWEGNLDELCQALLRKGE